MMRIEIAGALAAGKSTLAKRLSERGFRLVYEDLSTNPYLDLRKQDPERYELLCQRTFVDDKLRGVIDAVGSGWPEVICDYCLDVERAYFGLYLAHRPDWMADLDRRISQGIEEVGEADAIVYLTIDPVRQLQRIRLRARAFEQGHDVAFLERINGMVEEKVRGAERRGVRVIEVDSVALEADPANFDGLVRTMEGVFRIAPVSRENLAAAARQ